MQAGERCRARRVTSSRALWQL